jgi:Immunity protein 49
MEKIERHNANEIKYRSIRDKYSTEIENSPKWIDGVIENINTWSITSLQKGFWSVFYQSIYLSEQESAETFLFYSNELTKIIFELSKNSGKEITIKYDGQTKTLQGWEVGLTINHPPDIYFPWYWEECVEFALILRNQKTIDLLKFDCSWHEYRDRTIGSFNPDMIDMALYDFYNSLLFKNYAKSLELANTIITNLEENLDGWINNINHFKTVKDEALLLTIPSMYCFKSVFEGDEAAFNTYLYDALIKHKQYCTTKYKTPLTPTSNQDQLFVAMSLLTACSLAFDKGMKVEIESDYIPKWLIEKEYRFKLKQ